MDLQIRRKIEEVGSNMFESGKHSENLELIAGFGIVGDSAPNFYRCAADGRTVQEAGQ
jgi:hypothetical protein